MDRKGFLKSTMIATGSLLLGGAGICRFLNDKEPADGPFPRTIEKIHCGNMKKVLVIMSASRKRDMSPYPFRINRQYKL